MAKGNKPGHRRFGNVRKLPSDRYQASYVGPDGQRRYLPETYERKGDAERALSIIEAQMVMGDWTDPERGKVPLAVYAAAWIEERPELRPKTVELYTWLLPGFIAPTLGGVDVGKITPQMVRTWRSKLLAGGVSVSTTAKAYRLLRAVLMTAVNDDKMLARNPCRIKGADNEHAPERPVLTVAQVLELSNLVGRHPIGNVRKLASGRFRLRYREVGGEMCTSPVTYPDRVTAELALWALALEDQVEIRYDGRYRALVLLATFASLRWGEVIALRRSDIDLDNCTVRVREQLTELDGGKMEFGPPKSRAGKRTVTFPAMIVPALRAHLDEFVKDRPDAFVFLGARGGFLRGSNFRRAASWKQALDDLGLDELHFHDLRHAGNTLAARTGASMADLKARMGQDSDRAASIYHHASQDADQEIAAGLDARLRAEWPGDDDDDDGTAGVLAPVA